MRLCGGVVVATSQLSNAMKLEERLHQKFFLGQRRRTRAEAREVGHIQADCLRVRGCRHRGGGGFGQRRSRGLALRR